MLRSVLPALLSLSLLSGCLPDSTSSNPSESSQAGLSVRVGSLAKPELAARTVSADPGGRLTLEVSNTAKGILLRDSCTWTGGTEQELVFPSLTEGSGFAVRAWYRDPNGFTSHGDSLGGIRILRGEGAIVRLSLRPLLGKILLNAPSVPVGVDTLGMTWTLDGSRRGSRSARGSGGRTILRLDSLPIGKAGSLALRAWNAAGDTLFHLDTVLVLSDDRDLPLSLNLQSSRGSVVASLEVSPGGEIDVTASFAGESDQPSSQDGRLLLAAFSDSGASDWVGILNPGPDFKGTVRLGKGGTDAILPLDLPSGRMAVATRASCDAVAAPTHPLHGVEGLLCGQADVVVTHSTAGGTYWKLRSADASTTYDAVLVLDAKQSWPDLNTTTARTVRLRSGWRDAFADDAGPAWCADGSDSPLASCP